MSDWSQITIPEFDTLAAGDLPLAGLVARVILDRLPFAFDSKFQYLNWRDSLAEDLGLDGRDLAIVGSVATGRSLSSFKHFGVFNGKSDIDIAVISRYHFEQAWDWFSTTDANIVTGLDSVGQEKFEAHREHYIFEGVIAAEYFLSYLPFGTEWSKALKRSQENLPERLQGRLMRVRIYRSNSALRTTQHHSLETYRRFAQNRAQNKAENQQTE